MTQQSFSLSQWTKATSLGWFAGIILILILSSTLDAAGVEKFQFFVGVGLGAGVGFFQWCMLKKISTVDLTWVWSSLLGLGVPFLAFDLISMYSAQPLGPKYLPLSVGTGAVVIGTLQYFILKKYSSKAYMSVWGSLLGWPLAGATVLSIDYIKFIIHNNMALFFINLTMILAGGVVLGLVTGLCMKKIFGYGMRFNFQPTLEDGLVLLTPLRVDHFDALFNVASDPLIWELHPAKQRSTLEGFTEFFKECLASGGSLLIKDKKTGEVIGHSRFNATEGKPNAVEIGWTYLARRYWGGEYNRAVKYLMLDHAFRSFDEVLFYVDKENFRSQKAVEKIGGERIEHPESESVPVKSPRNVIFRIRKQAWHSNPLNRRKNSSA